MMVSRIMVTVLFCIGFLLCAGNLTMAFNGGACVPGQNCPCYTKTQYLGYYTIQHENFGRFIVSSDYDDPYKNLTQVKILRTGEEWSAANARTFSENNQIGATAILETWVPGWSTAIVGDIACIYNNPDISTSTWKCISPMFAYKTWIISYPDQPAFRVISDDLHFDHSLECWDFAKGYFIDAFNVIDHWTAMEAQNLQVQWLNHKRKQVNDAPHEDAVKDLMHRIVRSFHKFLNHTQMEIWSNVISNVCDSRLAAHLTTLMANDKDIAIRHTVLGLSLSKDTALHITSNQLDKAIIVIPLLREIFKLDHERVVSPMEPPPAIYLTPSEINNFNNAFQLVTSGLSTLEEMVPSGDNSLAFINKWNANVMLCADRVSKFYYSIDNALEGNGPLGFIYHCISTPY